MSGPKLATIAWRNLWRQKRRTILTLISIAFGLFLAILMTSMQDRSFADFIDTAARLGSGHVVIQHHEYLDSPSLSRTVQGTDAMRELAAQHPNVERVVDRITGEAMLATAHDSFGAAFIAYDPAAEDSHTFRFLEGIVEGEMYSTADEKGIVLGKTLARNLGVKLGHKVVYTMMDKNGEIVTDMGRLTGIIGTGAPSADAALFLLPIGKARKALGYGPNEATHVGIYLKDNRDSPEVAAAIKPKLDKSTVVLSWDEISPDLNAFVAMKIGGGRFFLCVIALLITAGIFNTLFMSVMERVREFGILVAIGYTPGQIFRMVMWESVWLSIVGLVIGTLITIGPYYSLSQSGIDMTEIYADQSVEVGGVGFSMVMHIGIFPEHAIFIAACIIVATLAAGIYPAWKAGHVDPVDSIKLV